MAFFGNVNDVTRRAFIVGIIVFGLAIQGSLAETIIVNAPNDEVNGEIKQPDIALENKIVNEGEHAEDANQQSAALNANDVAPGEAVIQQNESTLSTNPIDKEGLGGAVNNLSAASSDGNDNKTSNSRPKKVTCQPRNETNTNLTVQIMNIMWTVSPQDITQNKSNDGLCYAVLFYTPGCQFCAAAAPHYNALPRSFPDILCFAIDASAYYSLNARLGIVGLPTLMLFHGDQPVAKFNDSQYTLDRFSAFLSKYTGLIPLGAPNVTSADFDGPLSSVPLVESDPMLWFAWIFVILCCTFGITKSSIFNRIIETLRNNWHEAEAHHQHAD